MTIQASRVFAAWLKLNASERAEVIDLIKKYQDSPPSKQKEISLEHINESQRSFVKGASINFGPAPGTCPTCGR